MTEIEFGQINTLSGLIRVTINDMKVIENDRAYQIDMNHWHSKKLWSPTCAVCAAGAVMANTLKVPVTETIELIEFRERWNPDIYHRLSAINYLRLGWVYDAAIKIELDLSYELATILQDMSYEEVPEYEIDREGFYLAMSVLVEQLEALGL